MPISCRSPFTLARSGEGTIRKEENRSTPNCVRSHFQTAHIRPSHPGLSKRRRRDAVNNTATSPWLHYTPQ